MKEIDCSPFTDAICPEPSPSSSDWGDMGDVLSDAPAATKGEMSQVQFANLGNYSPAKIPGGGSY